MGEWMYIYTFSLLRLQLGVSGELHVPSVLPLAKEPSVSICRRLVEPRAGMDDLETRKFLTLPGIDRGARGWLRRHCATSRKVTASITDEVIQFTKITIFFQPYYCLGDDSASNRNEYYESSWEVERGRRERLTMSPSSVRLYLVIWLLCTMITFIVIKLQNRSFNCCGWFCHMLVLVSATAN
jgi:hypothetical protein